MLSTEPATVGSAGYPLLLQTGESYRGEPLHDRQHPHNLFMELVALYDVPVTSRVGVELYAAPVGEPHSVQWRFPTDHWPRPIRTPRSGITGRMRPMSRSVCSQRGCSRTA